MGKRLKLLVLSPWVSRHGGGVAEAVRLLAARLSLRDDLEVTVLSLDEKDGAPPLEGWGRAGVITARYFGPSNYRFSPGLLWRLLRSDADLVHVHGLWSFHCFAALVWSLLRRRPYVVSPHGMLEAWILRRSRLLKWVVATLYQTAFLRRAAAAHVLTGSEQRDVGRLAPRLACLLVPNGVEPPAGPSGSPAWWQPEFAGRMVFLYFGRIHVKKGWRELCAAWEQLCAADPGFAAASQLVFCGSVDRSPDFEPQVAKLAGRLGNVVFAGPQQGASRWSSLIAADAVVLPSRSEGLPMAVLEAWAAGVPVLMTSACNLPAGFEAGAAMELGPSAELIAAGLRAFFDLPPESRERMGQAGAELARRDFSLDAMESKLVELYRSCVAAQGNGCGSVVK